MASMASVGLAHETLLQALPVTQSVQLQLTFFIFRCVSGIISIITDPLDLVDMYGKSGIFLYLFGSQKTWRAEVRVLGDLNNDEAMSFKKSIQEECTIIAVAAAIVAQIAISGLSLNNLDSMFWLVKGFLSCSLVSSLIAVYYATTQQRELGLLLQPNQVRGWIRGSIPLEQIDSVPHALGALLTKKPKRVRYGDPHTFENRHGENTHSAYQSFKKQCFTPSIASVLTISAPQMLLSVALITLLIAFGMYFGFLWTQKLNAEAGSGNSRSVFIFYMVAIVVSFGVYSISRAIQGDGDYRLSTLLDMYVQEYARKNPTIISSWFPRPGRQDSDGLNVLEGFENLASQNGDQTPSPGNDTSRA